MAGPKNTAKNTDPAASPVFFALLPIDHDGVRYEPGEAIPAITDEQAGVLVAIGAAQPASPAT